MRLDEAHLKKHRPKLRPIDGVESPKTFQHNSVFTLIGGQHRKNHRKRVSNGLKHPYRWRKKTPPPQGGRGALKGHEAVVEEAVEPPPEPPECPGAPSLPPLPPPADTIEQTEETDPEASAAPPTPIVIV